MFDSLKKRFWKDVTVGPVEGGHRVFLDGRGLKTPAKVALVVPSARLAAAIGAEWDAVEAEIDPSALPYTKLSNAAIDKVVPQFDEIVEMLAAYGETDLLCHRADSPEGLVARQTAAWDPVLHWARHTHDLRLGVVAGILAGDQPAETIRALATWLQEQSAFSLMALHDLVTISGSILLARAVDGGFVDAQTAWTASRIDEDWQQDQWGIDSIAVADAQVKRDAFLRAADMLDMVRKG